METKNKPMAYSRPESPFGTWDIQVEGQEGDDGDMPDIESVSVGIKRRNGMFREICSITGGRNLADDSDPENCEPGNVRLILAAPLMYQALKMLLKGYDANENIFIGTIAIAKDAIKAAEEYELPYTE